MFVNTDVIMLPISRAGRVLSNFGQKQERRWTVLLAYFNALS